MLKHRFSALMIFHDAETPLCSTVHFSDAETPLRNTGDHFPNAETPLLDTFHFLLKSLKHPIPSSFSFPKQLRPALVSLFPLPLLQQHSQQPFIPLLLLKHRLSATFSSVSPMLKHHCSAFFSSPSHHLSHSPSSTKQFRPAIVSPLSLLKLHLPATFHHFIHDVETPSFSTL
jgi:hypothetical protein